MKGLSAIILAAGDSSRMKFSKALLPVNDEEVFFSRIVKVFRDFGCEQIVLVHNQRDESSIETIRMKMIHCGFSGVTNEKPENGRLYSLQLGINSLVNTAFCFMINVDNPCINVRILNKLYVHRYKSPVIIPTFQKKGGHPVLFNSEVLDYIKSTETENKTLQMIFEAFSCKRTEMNEPGVLVNINTPEEYHKNFQKNNRLAGI